MDSIKKLMMRVFLLGVLNPCQQSFAASEAIDGFVAYCTGNNDSTGLCKNEETGRSYTCQIIPGAVIDCMSSRSTAFQCVWISSPIANSAEFWCDKDVDQMLRNEFATTITDKEFKAGKENASSSSINDQEFEAEADSLGVDTEMEALNANEDGQNPSIESIDQAGLRIQIEQSKDLRLQQALPLLDLRSSENKLNSIDLSEPEPQPSQQVVDGIEAQLQLQQSQEKL